MFPTASRLTKLQLQDHFRTWLADVAQALIVLGTAEGDRSELLRDGTEIQRGIAERHGLQRFRLGWQEEALSREYHFVRDVIGELLDGTDKRVPVSPSARSLLNSLVHQAEAVSLRAFRQARATSPGSRLTP